MTKAKKLIVVLAAAALMLCMAGCGENNSQGNTNINNTTTDTATNSEESAQGDGGKYKQFDDTAFMLNGKEIKFPYYDLDKLCEVTGLYYTFTFPEDATLTNEDIYSEGHQVCLYKTKEVENRREEPHIIVYSGNLEDKKSIPTGNGYVLNVYASSEHPGIDISIRGITLGSTLEELLEAFKDFTGTDENKEMEISEYDDYDIYYFDIHVPDTFHEISFSFEVVDGKVTSMQVGDGSVSNYQLLD